MPVKQGLASLEDGFRVRYLGSLGFPNGSKKPGIQTLQRPMLQLYSAARRRGEDRRSTHSLALTQFLDVSDYGLVVVDIEEDPEDGELSPVITKVITPVENVVLWAAVRFHTRPTKRKSMGAAFVPIACSDGVLDKNAFIQLGAKQRFLVSLTHPPLFVCLLQRVANPKSIECHAFVCSTAEDALSISSMVGGSKEERGPTGTLGYFTAPPKSSSHTFKSSREPSHSEEDLLSTSTLTPSSLTTATEATSSRLTVDSNRVSRVHYTNGHSRNELKYKRSRSLPRPAPDESSLDYAEFRRDHLHSPRELSPLHDRRRRELSPVVPRREMSPITHRREMSPITHRSEMSPLASRREPSPTVLRREMSPLTSRRGAAPMEINTTNKTPVAGRREIMNDRRDFSPVLGRRDEQSPIIERRGENGGVYHDSPVLGRRYENGVNDRAPRTPKLSKRFVQSKFYDKKEYAPPKPPRRRAKSLNRLNGTSSPEFSGDNSDFNYRNDVIRDDTRNSNHIATLGTPPKSSSNGKRILPQYQFGQHEKSFQTNSSEQSNSPPSSEEFNSNRKPREMVTMSHTVDFSSEGESTVRNSYLTKNSVRKTEEKSRSRRDIDQQNGHHSFDRRSPSPPNIRDAGTMTEKKQKKYISDTNSDLDESDLEQFRTRNGHHSEGTQTYTKNYHQAKHKHMSENRIEDFRTVNGHHRVVETKYQRRSDESDSDPFKFANGIRVEQQREYAEKLGDTGLYKMVQDNREYRRKQWETRVDEISTDSESHDILKHPKFLRSTKNGTWVTPSLYDDERERGQFTNTTPKMSPSSNGMVSSGTQTRSQYINSNVRYEEERVKTPSTIKDNNLPVEIMGNGTSRVTITVPYVRDAGSRVSDCSYAHSGASYIPQGVRSYHRRNEVRNWSTVSVTSDQSYQGSSTLPLAKSRHHQNNKVIRWSSVEDLPRRRGFLTSIKRFSVRSLTRAKKKTGRLFNTLKSKMKSDKPKRGYERNVDGDPTYESSEVCLRPDGNGRQNALKKKKKRQQSWSFHDLRTEFPAGRPSTKRRTRYGSQDDLLERNGSPGGSGNSNNSARELISRKKKRKPRYGAAHTDESSDSGVEEYPSDYSEAIAAARSRRATTVPRKFASEVTLLTIDSPSNNNNRKARHQGRWSQTDLHGELGYIP